MSPNEREDMSMGDSLHKVNYHEPVSFGRLLIRSALLGLLVPVTQGEFWDVKVVQVVFALVLCVVLYGLEKAILWPFRERLSIRPIHLATYRGSLLYTLMIFVSSGDWLEALGAGIAGALVAMGLFKLEDKILIKRSGVSSPGNIVR